MDEIQTTELQPTSIQERLGSTIPVTCPWITNDEHRTQIRPQMLYIYLKEQKHLLVSRFGISRRIHIYNPATGTYYLLQGADLREFIKGYLPPEYRTKKHIDMVVEEFMTDTPDCDEADFDTNENIIVFENGVYHLLTGKLLPHSPEYLATRSLPCSYIPNKSLRDAPVFYSFISDMTGGDKGLILLIMQILGVVFSNIPGYYFKKLIVFLGAGDTGKSVLRRLVTDLVGNAYCHSIDIKTLNARFGTSQIAGKRLVGSGDMSFAELNEIDVIKELTGGDSINAERKGQDAFSFRFDGILWFNTNKLPSFHGDRGNHVYERFLIIPCEHPVPPEKRDALLAEKLLKERDIIVSVSMAFARTTVKNNFHFTETKQVENCRKQYQQDNNSLYTFVCECCILYDGRTSRADFNKVYRAWCRTNGVRMERFKDIEPMMYELFHITSSKSNTFYYPLTLTVYLDDSGELGAMGKNYGYRK